MAEVVGLGAGPAGAAAQLDQSWEGGEEGW